MSLLEEAKEGCIKLIRASSTDNRGGTDESWIDGEKFMASIYLDNSLQSQMAEIKGVKGIYQIIVKKDIRLPFNSVFRRIKDSHVFRVTSKDDCSTPDSAGLNMRVVRAEDYSTLE